MFANTMSGSLDKAEQSIRRQIRHEILCLAEGGGPIYIFEALPKPATWSGGLWGLFHMDFSPAAILAAQAHLNYELGSAVFVRKVPALDMRTPGGFPNFDWRAEVYVFEDSTANQFVLAGWTPLSETNIEVSLDPAAYNVGLRDIQGNDRVVSGSDSFTWTLTQAPSYVRVDRSITAAGLTGAIDHMDPLKPTVYNSWEDEGRYSVRFRFVNRGDADSLRLYYRSAAETTWAAAGEFEAWLHPDSGYTGSFEPAGPGPFYARASAIERTTGDESFSLEYFLGPTAVEEANEPAVLPWEDALFLGGPNPSTGGFALHGSVAQGGAITLRVYDLAGRRIRQTEQANSAAGPYRFDWDGRGDGGRSLASGVYFLEVTQGERKIGTRRVVLLR